MQYPSTIEPKFYAYYNGNVIYSLNDGNEQYTCGNKIQATASNCPYILVTLGKEKTGGDEISIRLYLDYLISVGDKWVIHKFSPCEDTNNDNTSTYLDRLIGLQKSDITEMVLQGYSKEYIESVIPYYLKTNNTEIQSDGGVIVSGYSPYIYLHSCVFYRYEGSEGKNLINDTPINLDDSELWKDIALSEAQKTADKILTLGGQETQKLLWEISTNLDVNEPEVGPVHG